MKDLTEAQKMDILLSFRGSGYNLQDTEDPATMKMSLGTGYTLFASIKNSWVIELNDGTETTKYNIDSVKVPYTHAKDAQKLFKEYEAECKKVLEGIKEVKHVSEPPKKQKKAKPPVVKNEVVIPGMVLPVVYPSDMKGSFMRFKQWTADNNVIPKGSEVVILDEDESRFKVTIPQAHISFEISKKNAELVEA